MPEKFVVKHKDAEKKEDKSVVLTLRLDKTLKEGFDDLAIKSDRSRNELMCMALKYALENLDFISNDQDEKK